MRSHTKIALVVLASLTLSAAAGWLFVQTILRQNIQLPGSPRQEAHWSLDPAHPPRPDSVVIPVLVNDIQCASGVSPEDRLFPPLVVQTEDTVVITFSATRPPGRGQTCPTHPPVRRVVLMDRVLGDRILMDGGYSPPRLVDADTPAPCCGMAR